MDDRHIRIFATGGTIAGTAGSATRRDYRPGQIGIERFIRDIAALGIDAKLKGEQFANIGSEDMGPPVWANLHAAASSAIDDPQCAGIIITHGTDTAEETAFLLDQTLPTTKPIVLVGAMRAADAVGSDGLRNFANAIRVAGDAGGAGRGVVLVMSDQIFAARDARKAHTENINAFKGFPRGPVGQVTPTSLEWFGPAWRDGEGARYAYPDSLPEVPILYAYAGMSPQLVSQATQGNVAGLVLAGFGHGNAPRDIRDALAKTVERGVAVVRASRVDEGLVDREPEDDAAGFIAARALGPPRARILLQLLLANGITDPAAIQKEFNRR